MEKPVNCLTIALNSATLASTIAMCAAQPFAASDTPPEFIHLLPAGEIRTGDNRGPYRVVDAAKLIAASLQAGGRLVLDENHSTDLAAPKGLPAPAMGWIIALESRADGIWGKVEWTAEGQRLVTGKAYRGISPVISHDKSGTIARLLRASLVNQPNFTELTTLHSEDHDMNLLAKLNAALKLPTETSEDALVAAITTMHQAQTDAPAKAQTELTTALQAQLAPIAKAIGLDDKADGTAVLNAVATLKTTASPDQDTIMALQTELVDVTKKLNALSEGNAKKSAEAFVDKAIADLRVGVKAQRDRFVTMHMADPTGTEAIINDLPMLNASGALPTPPVLVPGTSTSLNSEQASVAAMLGIDPAEYAKTLAAEAAA